MSKSSTRSEHVPMVKRTFAAMEGSVHVKRGLGAFWVFGVADFLAQVWARYRYMIIVDAKSDDFEGPSKQGYDTRRKLRARWDGNQFLRTAFFGAFFYAPLRMRWHKSLDRIFPLYDRQPPAEHRTMVLRRFAAEHVLFLPLVVFGYFSFHSLMELRPIAEAPRRAASGLGTSVLVSWVLWIPIQGLCFWVLPPFTWNAIVSLVTVAWVGYMADLNRRLREQLLLEEQRAEHH